MDRPLARLAALAALGAAVAVVARSWAEGRFRPGAAVVVVDDRAAGRLEVSAVRRGRPWPLPVSVGEGGPREVAAGSWPAPGDPGPVVVALPPGAAGRLTVTALRRLPDGAVVPLPVSVVAGSHRFDAALAGGAVSVPLDGAATVALAHPEPG